MHSFGLTCPKREKIWLDGVDKYRPEYLHKLTINHEKICKRCKDDYQKLYDTGMLNGKKPSFMK